MKFYFRIFRIYVKNFHILLKSDKNIPLNIRSHLAESDLSHTSEITSSLLYYSFMYETLHFTENLITQKLHYISLMSLVIILFA
jgi:hypothetical protein